MYILRQKVRLHSKSKKAYFFEKIKTGLRVLLKGIFHLFKRIEAKFH